MAFAVTVLMVVITTQNIRFELTQRMTCINSTEFQKHGRKHMLSNVTFIIVTRSMSRTLW